MHGDRQRTVANRLRPPVVEQRDVGGPGNLPGHFTLRVVIAQDQIDRDAGPVEPLQLGGGREGGAEIAHVGIEQIAGQEQKIGLFVETNLHKIVESRRVANRNRSMGCAGVLFEPTQRAVEMNVGGMQKFDCGGGHPLRFVGHRGKTSRNRAARQAPPAGDS